LIAQDQRATRISFSYLKSAFTKSAYLASLVDDITANEIKLTNRLSAICFPCTAGSLRGWSNPVGVLSEVAFYRLEGSFDSDAEVQQSVRRGMLSFPHPKLVKISTPYAKSGVLYHDFKTYFARDDVADDILVWKASSLLMNPGLGAERLEREKALDPSRWLREYGAEFAEDLDSMFSVALLEDLVVRHRYELAPRDSVTYFATCDPSGGSTGPNRDAFTVCLCHTEGTGETQHVVQDFIHGWSGTSAQSLDLAGIVKEIARILCRYRVTDLTGDKYAGAWIRQAFEREGVRYLDAALTKSEAYLEAEPLMTQQRVALLDHPQMVRELSLLERRPRAQGRTQVDHPSGQHDDFANVVCLGIALLSKHANLSPWFFQSEFRRVYSTPPPPPAVTPVASVSTPSLLHSVADVATSAASSVMKKTINAEVTKVTHAVPATARPITERLLPDDTPDGQTFMGVPTHQRLSPEEIRTLPKGSRSAQEQQRLDEFERREAATRVPAALEMHIRTTGIYWPTDGHVEPRDAFNDALVNFIALKYARWK
jgi:hypothetical protein